MTNQLWVKTTSAKFAEYGITITTQRKLSDGEYIMHMELLQNPEFMLSTRDDTAVHWYSNEEMDAILALEPKEV